MNRPLKFMAWHKSRKIMCPVRGIGFKAWHPGCDLNFVLIEDNGAEEVSPYEVELMQFTGLLDKHGKEIYEGYIADIHKGMFVVIGWNEETAAFCAIHNGEKSDHLYAAEYSEIIGNIYENEDLLNI